LFRRKKGYVDARVPRPLEIAAEALEKGIEPEYVWD
jgi:hypothetical protein